MGLFRYLWLYISIPTMLYKTRFFFATLILGGLLFGCSATGLKSSTRLDPIDYVDPYMGNISHLLVPTFPTIHLPNGMMRVHPQRSDYASEQIAGLPVLLTSHRGVSAFSISPRRDISGLVPQVTSYSYDGEQVRPYLYETYLVEPEVKVDYAPSYRSAIYRFDYEGKAGGRHLVFSTKDGELVASGKAVFGYQQLEDSTRVYVYAETDVEPSVRSLRDPKTGNISAVTGVVRGETLCLTFPKKTVSLRYGVSYISVEQARRNVEQEIQSFELGLVAKYGRNEWSKALDKIQLEGGTPEELRVFYTSLYRTYERMICLSEDGRYWSGFDKKVHDDEGVPFYTDDWLWDTYRATHPLRILLDPVKEQQMLTSYLRMAEQSPEGWLPTFPEVTGDTHRMNGTHTIATFADAYAKGVTGFSLSAAYQASKKTLAEKSYLPWTRREKGVLSKFMDEKGYFPALHPGERETIPEVTLWEKRQSVAVSLGAAYDYWCLSQLAKFSGHDGEHADYLRRSYDYRKLFNYDKGFFHPKDSRGRFIEPFDYELSGGLGARDYYDENNAYTYRWDVQHNPADLIYLMGGRERFISLLDETLRTPLSKSKWEFYSQLPDQTGNVGQFAMSNEPSLHIPYLYNYAGAPWRTQRLVRKLIDTWFRSDLMGMPGDEDGGGMSAFVVFSMMGIYPVTPGMPVYNIGTPFFSKMTLKLASGRTFVIEAEGASSENKYIQKATLNGKPLDRPWLRHSELAAGGKLVFTMGPRPNKSWGVATPPPSAERVELTK